MEIFAYTNLYTRISHPRGTGRKAYVNGYRVGGKTGTSQIAKNGVYLDENIYYLLSLGEPMNGPKLVAYIAMKKPKNCVRYGGSTVGTIINKVIEDSLDMLNVPKNYNGVEREYTWMNEKYYTVEVTKVYKRLKNRSKGNEKSAARRYNICFLQSIVEWTADGDFLALEFYL